MLNKAIAGLFAATLLLVVAFAAVGGATAGKPGACDAAIAAASIVGTPTGVVRITSASAQQIDDAIQVPGAVGDDGSKAHVDSPARANGFDAGGHVKVCILSGVFSPPTPPQARQGPRDRAVVLVYGDGTAQLLSVGFADTHPAGIDIP